MPALVGRGTGTNNRNLNDEVEVVSTMRLSVRDKLLPTPEGH